MTNIGGAAPTYAMFSLRYIFDPGQRRFQDFVFAFKYSSLG